MYPRRQLVCKRDIAHGGADRRRGRNRIAEGMLRLTPGPGVNERRGGGGTVLPFVRHAISSLRLGDHMGAKKIEQFQELLRDPDMQPLIVSACLKFLEARRGATPDLKAILAILEAECEECEHPERFKRVATC